MYKTILVAVDGSSCSEHAARVALALAQRIGAKLVFCLVLDGGPQFYSRQAHQIENAVREAGQTLLQRWQHTARNLNLEASSHFVEQHLPAEGIVTTAKEEQAELIVMGTHSREGLAHWVLGSVAERVVRRATVPVLLVRRGEAILEFKRILVGLDGSDLSQLALEQAKQLCGYLGSTLLALHVVPQARMHLHEPRLAFEYEQAALRKEGQQLLEQATHDLPQAQRLLENANGRRVGDVIAVVANQQQADLVVLGTHGRSGLDHWLLGSVAERVVHQTRPAVLLVRQTPKQSEQQAEQQSVAAGAKGGQS